jgi:ABC-2 type transport system ATP-binding protein
VIIYSTHQMDLAERLCDRIALIHRGAVRLQGDLESIRSNHGGNMVVVEFDGEGAFLTDIGIVRGGKVDGNRAELELDSDATINQLFQQIGDRVVVSRIEKIRPSLNTIFIQTVGEADAPDDMIKRREQELVSQ